MYEHRVLYSIHEKLSGRAGLDIEEPDGSWYGALERALEYDRAVNEVNG